MSDIFDQSASFEDGMNARPASFSNQYHVKRGGFGDEVNGVKTYVCTLTVEQLKDDITTFRKLTEDNVWPVSQIIQREIDFKRVEEISSHYLRQEGRDIKYFPPITVAILPKGENDRIAKEYLFDEEIDESVRVMIFNKSLYSENQKAKEIFKNATDYSSLKDFYVLEISKPFNYNILCWNKSEYFAVVIDGQHRYESLLNAASKKADFLNYVQDVVFIDLSDTIRHVKKSESKELEPVKAIRTVFVDINNSAKMITPVRRILMDDKDLASLFVQSLVNDEDDDGSRKGKYILPQLIDWHVESYKHELPHVTSILLLYQIMSDYVLKRKNLSSLDDLRHRSKVKNWVNLVNEKFQVDTELKSKTKYQKYIPLKESLDSYLKVLDENELDFEDDDSNFIFSYDYRILQVAQKSFSQLYLESIVKCFNELRHFSEVKMFIEESGGLNPENNLYKALVSPKSEVEKNQFYKNAITGIKDSVSEKSFAKKYNLLYTVLGQKAIFDLFFKKMDEAYVDDFNNQHALNVAEKFILDFNQLLEILEYSNFSLFEERDTVIIPSEFHSDSDFLGVLVKSFWEGIIFEEKRIIYTTRGVLSLKRMLEYLLQYVSNYRSNKSDLAEEEFRISYMEDRIRRLIIKQDPDLESDAPELAKKVVNIKREFLNKYLSNAIDKWQESKN